MTQTAKEYCHQGRNEELTPAGNERAKEFYRRAIEADPDYMPAYAELSYVFVRDFQNAWGDKDRQASLDEALRLAQRAVDLVTNSSAWHNDFRGWWYRAIVYWNLGDFDKSYAEFAIARSHITLLRRFIDEPDLDADMAEALVYGGEPELAVAMIEDAIRRKSGFPYWVLWNLGRAYYMCGQYRNAIATIDKIENPPNDVRLITAASHAQLADIDTAKAIMAKFSAEDRDWTIEKAMVYHYRRLSDRDLWIDGLQKAGLRDK